MSRRTAPPITGCSLRPESSTSVHTPYPAHARLRPAYRDTWHHCYNRAVGTASDRPFDDADKEQFVSVLGRVEAFYAVRIVAYQVMSNHFHLLLQAPAAPPSEEETIRRRGPLWAGRFKNGVLDNGAALWACWQYIEFNPVRAGMIADPADYRFCSYGVWSQTGRHPFGEALGNWLIPALPVPLRTLTPTEVRRELRQSFARMAAEEAEVGEEEVANAVAAAGQEPPFTLSARRHVRHWVDGLVIGSELFVRDTMRRVRSESEVRRHRLANTPPFARLNPRNSYAQSLKAAPTHFLCPLFLLLALSPPLSPLFLRNPRNRLSPTEYIAVSPYALAAFALKTYTSRHG